MNEEYSKSDLKALAAFAEDWHWANVPGVLASSALHCERANAMVCLQDWYKFGGTDRLFKACQWLWGVNPPENVEVYGNAPFKYRLRENVAIVTYDLKAPAESVTFDLTLGWWTVSHGNWSEVVSHDTAMGIIEGVRLRKEREKLVDVLRVEVDFLAQEHEVDRTTNRPPALPGEVEKTKIYPFFHMKKQTAKEQADSREIRSGHRLEIFDTALAATLYKRRVRKALGASVTCWKVCTGVRAGKYYAEHWFNVVK